MVLRLRYSYLNPAVVKCAFHIRLVRQITAGCARVFSRSCGARRSKLPKAALSEKLDLLLKESSQLDFNLRDSGRAPSEMFSGLAPTNKFGAPQSEMQDRAGRLGERSGSKPLNEIP